MNEIREWTFEGAQIRTVEVDGGPWFVGKDVAALLGYSNTRKALADHVDKEDKRAGVTIRDGSQGRAMVIINESGVYALIFGSKLAAAKRFKRWVTSEVLPAIRRTGRYEQKPAIEKPDSYMIGDPGERAKRWIEETHEWEGRIAEMQDTIDTQRIALHQKSSKVDAMDAILGAGKPIRIGDMARVLQLAGLDTNQAKLFEWMRAHDWIERGSGRGRENVPTSRALAGDMLTTKETTIHADGGTFTRVTPLVTPTGAQFLLDLMTYEREGSFPEQEWHTGRTVAEVTIKIKR